MANVDGFLKRSDELGALIHGLLAQAWQDASGQVWLSYNDPRFLETRHGIRECGEAAKRISGTLEELARQATQ